MVCGIWGVCCALRGRNLETGLWGFDYDGQRIESLSEGRAPIYEPELDQVIQDGIQKRNLTFSTEMGSLKTCDFVFLSYDTPGWR